MASLDNATKITNNKCIERLINQLKKVLLQRCRIILASHHSAPYIIYRQGGVGMGKVLQLVILQPLYRVGRG